MITCFIDIGVSAKRSSDFMMVVKKLVHGGIETIFHNIISMKDVYALSSGTLNARMKITKTSNIAGLPVIGNSALANLFYQLFNIDVGTAVINNFYLHAVMAQILTDHAF